MVKPSYNAPQYLDPGNEDQEAVSILDSSGAPNANSQLTSINRLYERQFKIVSFRWLHNDEV